MDIEKTKTDRSQSWGRLTSLCWAEDVALQDARWWNSGADQANRELSLQIERAKEIARKKYTCEMREHLMSSFLLSRFATLFLRLYENKKKRTAGMRLEHTQTWKRSRKEEKNAAREKRANRRKRWNARSEDDKNKRTMLCKRAGEKDHYNHHDTKWIFELKIQKYEIKNFIF